MSCPAGSYQDHQITVFSGTITDMHLKDKVSTDSAVVYLRGVFLQRSNRVLWNHQ